MQEDLLVKISKLTGPNPGMELPPRIFKEMEGECFWNTLKSNR